MNFLFPMGMMGRLPFHRPFFTLVMFTVSITVMNSNIYCIDMAQDYYFIQPQAVSELAATATAGSPGRHALKYKTPLATPQATVVAAAAAVATSSETA